VAYFCAGTLSLNIVKVFLQILHVIENILDRHRVFRDIMEEGVSYTLSSSFPFPEEVAGLASSSEDSFYPLPPCA